MDQGLPLVVPLTVTFSIGSTRPDQVLCEYERFYLRLCHLLMCNHERASKRHLLPFALAFRDDPSTRPGKHRDRPTAFAVFSNHPSVAPHPMLVDRFLGIVDALEETWRRIPARTADPTSAHDAPRYANRSLHADVPFALGIRELMRADPVGSMSQVRKRIRVVVDYCAKLGQRRDVNDEVDLFTVLPPAYLGRTCVHVESSVVVSVAPGPATRKAHETPIITLPKWRYSRRLLISGKISRSGHI